MSLAHRPLLYVFLETADLAAQRAVLETDVGLRLLGVDDREGVRHGVVTYHAGTVLCSLNLSPRTRFARPGADALLTVFNIDRTPASPGPVTDGHGHHYLHRRCATACQVPSVTELRLATEDLAGSAEFYDTVLGLGPSARDADSVRYSVGAITLVLERFPSPLPVDRNRVDTYLLVFHTPSIRDTCAALADRGLEFSGRKVGTREFGDTIRFADPNGHRFCLYEPSAEALATPVGSALRQIVAGCDYLLPRGSR